jgi:hypothetical protein
MRVSLAFAAVLVLASLALAQSDTRTAKSPKEVVRGFVRLELEGARLTPEGRRETGNFLVLPSTQPPYPINIVSDKFDIDEIPSPENKPKLNVYFPYLYGQLDSALRFKASIHMRPGNGLIREGTNVEYSLVLADKNGDLEPKGRQTNETRAVQEWKIENPPSFSMINLATAIRYVNEMRDKATDPAIKKNASDTLAKLKKLTDGKS